MATYVWHQGELIDKRDRPPTATQASEFPSPSVHGFAAYESPIDGASITSNRQRERDLNRSDSYDPRDTPQSFRKARDARTKWKSVASG